MAGFCENILHGHHRQHGRRRHGRTCSLKELPNGCKARILDMLCSDDQRLRLCAMGLTPGTSVESCEHHHGICRLMVRGCALALDGELANQVMCEEE